MTQPAFRRGGEEAQEAAASSGAQFAKTHFLTISEEEPQVALRYLTDYKDWIFVEQHGFVPTKNAPEGVDANSWPKSMPAVCRKDKAFAGLYNDCYICEHMGDIKNNWGKPVNKKSVRVWALAVLREEVVGTEAMLAAGEITPEQLGARLGFRDATREVQETDDEGKPIEGKTREERALVVVNMAPGNYFNGLTATGQVYGTVCDRDFIVRRQGKDKDTEYTHIPMNPTEKLKPGTEAWERYLKAIEEQKLDLEALVSRNASDDYYGRFFDPTKTVESKGSGVGTATEAPVPAAGATEVDPDKLAAMKERVRAGTSGAAAKPSALADVD